MSGIFTVVAGGAWLQHPISNMCQLRLLLPAYMIRGSFVLRACIVLRHSFTVIVLTTLVMASTLFPDCTGLLVFVLLQCLVLFSLHCSNCSSLGINLVLPLLGVVGQLFFCVLTIHCCRCCMYCLCMLTSVIKHQCQSTPELYKTLGVRGRQTWSPCHHSKIGVSQNLGELMFKSLIYLP